MISPTVKSAFWYTASNILVKAIGFITIPLFTRLLTQDEFGVYNNYLSWLSVATVVVTLSLEATLISAKKDYPDDLAGYAVSLVVLSQFSAVAWLVLANCAMPLFVSVTALDGTYVNCILIYLLFLPAITIVQTWERFVYQYKVTVALSLGMSVGMAVLSLALGLMLPNHLEGVILGRTAPVVLLGFGVAMWLFLRKKRIKIAYWKYAIPIAWPFVPHLLAMTLLGAVNKIFITQICGADANALYSLAYSCGLLVALFITSLNSAFSPWLGDRLTERDYDRIREVSKPYFTLFCGLTFAVSLVAPEILFIMGGESYLPAMCVMPPVAMGCVFQFVYCMYVNIEQYEKKTKGMAVASLSAAALNIMLDVLLIPLFGYMAAAWATAISYGWLMVIHMLLVRKMGFSCVYDAKFNIFFAVFTCMCIGACSLLYDFPIIRWSVLLIATLFGAYVAWKKRRQLLAIINRD